MKYLTFGTPEQAPYEICFLVPELHKAEILRHYITPHLADLQDHIIAYDLYKEPKKTPAALRREYLADLLPVLEDLGTQVLVTCDAEYFKLLSGKQKIDTEHGYIHDSVIGSFKTLYCPNFRSVFYNPEKVEREIRQSLSALRNYIDGSYNDPGIDIIKFAAYPQTATEIRTWLQRLLEMDCDLTADIETFSLKHHTAGIGTISFAWSRHEGIAFPVDLHPDSLLIRGYLRDFFTAFSRKMIWHNISFDVYVLVYQLFMADLLDTEGMLTGLKVMLRNWDCTKLITYLATNSCAGNQLGLKQQTMEFAGNYAVEEITDIRSIPLDELLQYNLIDTLSTWYVYEKHWDTLDRDNQLEIYQTLFQPVITDIIQMQLTGLPLDMPRVQEVHAALQVIAETAAEEMRSNLWIQRFEEHLRWSWREKKHQEWKKKRIELHEVPVNKNTTFNPNSGPQLQVLLFDEQFLGLPVLDLTETKQPATGGKTLGKLLNHSQDPEIRSLIQALIDYMAVNKLLTDFLPRFLEAPRGPDGWHYLFGNFNLGGTVSGRLSSSKPNMQNLPANVYMRLPDHLLERLEGVLGAYVKEGILSLGKLIKSCFRAPPGWLLVGLDYSSLEDRISALTTKDPNKIKVYTEGYDGHCLRAYSYFGEHMPDIDPASVASINSIEKLYKSFRQDSKAPTFALTYQGTYHTLMANCGFTEDLAKRIEASYHELYLVSDQWIADRLKEASQTGYITAAFGLRVRTPLLRQVILGTSRTPFEAAAEGRTAGNALGQSWCLLNSRSWMTFMAQVRESRYRLTIRLCAQIHDAGYVLIPDDLEHILYVNEHLVRETQWQDHPDIWHDEVKLGGEVSIFYPTWAEELTIPNGATAEEIEQLAAAHIQKYGGA